MKKLTTKKFAFHFLTLCILVLADIGSRSCSSSPTPQPHLRSYLSRRKQEWLRAHLRRSKRDIGIGIGDDGGGGGGSGGGIEERLLVKYQQQTKPCPRSCTCSYDTINCNDLIDACPECVHWRQIDFNQISHIGPKSFRNFHFAPNRTTHIIIYKLLNSTIGTDTFDLFRAPENSEIEVTFQYNSMIRFDRLALKGLRVEKNATVIFNFPYTTQVRVCGISLAFL